MMRKGSHRTRAAEKTDKGFISITGAKTRLKPLQRWIPSTPLICKLWDNAMIVDVVAIGGMSVKCTSVYVCVCVFEEVE